MWTYSQSGGEFIDIAGRHYVGSYAGRDEGKNNPILQDVREGCRFFNGEWVPIDGLSDNDYGPLPQGYYTINSPVDTTTHGPYVLWLTPGPGNEMHHREGFGIHGDSKETPGLASEGCICTPPLTRHRIWDSMDHELQVIE